MNKNMIVMDLDGTLLNSNKKCSDNSKQYLTNLKNQGYIIVLATGRVLDSAIRVTDGGDFANYIISNGGSIIYDIENRKIIYKEIIELEKIKNLYLSYQNQIESFVICDAHYYHRYNPLNKLSIDDKEIENIVDFLKDDIEVVHLCIHLKEDVIIQNIKFNLQEKYPILQFLIMQDSFSSNQWIDVFPNGISKYHAITLLADMCKIKNNDIIAIGDGLNDKEMIVKCGVGVAMGNALDELKDNAKYITLSHDDDGVVYFLKEYLNI